MRGGRASRGVSTIAERRDYSSRASSVTPSDSGYSSQSTATEDHAELDILDTLDLSETSAHVNLKELLLGTGDDPEDTLLQLGNFIQSRILEGHGETLFDLGQEDNGESMGFSKEHWDIALDRLRRAAATLRADCRILMTRNVGGEQEVGAHNDKDTSATGKIMIRQASETVEDVIETRIAVVGNGELHKILHCSVPLTPASRRGKIYHARCFSQR